MIHNNVLVLESIQPRLKISHNLEVRMATDNRPICDTLHLPAFFQLVYNILLSGCLVESPRTVFLCVIVIVLNYLC